MNLKGRLVFAFLACGLVPLAVTAIVGYWSVSQGMSAIEKDSGKALEDKAYEKLIAVRDIKKVQVEDYLKDRKSDMTVLVDLVNTLRDEAFKKLTAVREIKKSAVERYFKSIESQIVTFSEDQMIIDALKNFREAMKNVSEGYTDEQLSKMKDGIAKYYTEDFSKTYQEANAGNDPNALNFLNMLDRDSIVLQHHYISGNKHPLGEKHNLDLAEDGSNYSDLHASVHPIVRSYLEKFGYYDIFLVAPDTGDIIYSVFKELDYTTSLIDGPYADTNFGEVFRRANQASNKDFVVLVDYESYTPSYEAPASFIASPVFDGDTKVGVAIFQMPIDRLNHIMAERAGLGQTGETYLVGPDHLMRSDSLLDTENRSVNASFRKPDTGKVKTKASQAAVSGTTNTQVVLNYQGNPVVSAFSPVKVGESTWGLIGDIDVSEAFCPKISGSDKDFYTRYKERYGYYDLFLINSDGYCFYTVEQEPDYQTNLLTGPYKDSGLGKLVRKVLQTKEFGFADFEPYAPSNGDPAAFIAQPVLNSDREVEAIVALQLPLDTINKFMSAQNGMGTTGRTFILGNDSRRRSDSAKNPEETVKNAFKSGNSKLINNQATQEGLAGNSGITSVQNGDNNNYLTAYTPVTAFDTQWALLAQIEEREALKAVANMKEQVAASNTMTVIWNCSVAFVFSLIIVILAFKFANSISAPIVKAAEFAKSIASGNLTVNCDAKAKAEMGELIKSMNEMGSSLRHIIQEVTQNSTTLSEASARLSSTAYEMSSGAENTQNQAMIISAAIQEMSASTAEVSRSASQSASVTEEARGLADVANDKITNLRNSAEKIDSVVETINSVSEQTSLLSLNATIEAARAGEYGRGFAVVANEVKELAKQTGKSTNEIRANIKGIQEAIGEAVNSVGKISDIVHEISQLSQTIATSVGEQKSTNEEIAGNVSGTEKTAQESALVANQTRTAATELADLSNKLQVVVGKFQV